MDKKRRKKLTLDNSTFASNPGEVKFNPLVWLRYEYKAASIFFAILAISCLLAWLVTSWLLILVFIAFFLNIFYWKKSSEHYTADSNGGIIISVEPPLAAVFIDLTKGEGFFPVIKVIDYKVNKEIKKGDRIATVSTYTNNFTREDPCWMDVFPWPIEYATNDQNTITAALNTYSNEYWELLVSGIKEVPKPYKEGLYRVFVEKSDWVNLPPEDEEEDKSDS